MGKRPPPELQYFTRRFSERLKSAKINDKTLDSHTGGGVGGVGGSIMEGSPAVASASSEAAERRVPLGEVVADCVRRWFQDTLKEARNGDTGMQVLVGQMYHSGYGIARNDQKAKAWITKASKYRSSVWKVSDKRPGYNASDSDSDEVKDDKN
ncbi:uncharacterized protein M6B38_153105 [Iris pallida]|uniref:Uncharacterized protein n=1 Tax=Iris pallida TaxID=29817 RepID=A0AAX6F5B6_IRIPA|nr:uncharacterized protein M6B38_153105 [Iris pallida]